MIRKKESFSKYQRLFAVSLQVFYKIVNCKYAKNQRVDSTFKLPGKLVLFVVKPVRKLMFCEFRIPQSVLRTNNHIVLTIDCNVGSSYIAKGVTLRDRIERYLKFI